VGGFDNRVVEAIIALFMVISGVNFALHFRVLRGKPLLLLRDPEFRIYAILLAGVTLLLAGDLLLAAHGSESSSWFRLAAFQAASFVSTTGFSTADFSSWPAFSCALLFALLFVGGCAGSTSGSVKVARIVIVAKKLAVDIKRLVRPNAVLPVRLGRMSIPDEIVTSVTTFFILFIVVFAVGGLTLSAFGLDAATAFSASAACLSNFGPGFGSVGPASNYAALPVPVKLVLVVLMIVGRLELYTVLVTIYLSRRLFRT
jgi:trk system potassium uptake protein TrkH